MDGSSLPEPPHRDDPSSLRSLLSRAAAANRPPGAMPAGGNPFARFAHDGSAPGAISAAAAAASYKQPPPQVPMPLHHGLAPAAGPASAAGVRPPAMMNGMGAAPTGYRQEDEMDDMEPSAKRRRPVGRGSHREDDEDDGEHGEIGLHVGASGAAAGMSAMAYPSSGTTDPSNSLYHTQPLPMGYTTTVTTSAAVPGDAHRRNNSNRIAGLHQPTRPGVVVHAGAATPGGGFRSIAAGAHHHAQPVPTAAGHAAHGPSTLAAVAASYGQPMPGGAGGQLSAWPPQGMVPFGAGGVPGMPGHAAAGLIPNFGAGGAAAAGGHLGHMAVGGHGVVNPYGVAYGGGYAAAGAPGMFVPPRHSAGSEESPLVVVGRRRRRNGAPVDLSSGGGDDDDSEDGEGSGGADADAAEEVLQRVELISRNLKGALGHQQQLQAGLAGMYGGPSGGGAAPRQLVTAADIARAVGSEEVAARLKPYQLIGINYLLQLAAGQVGGAILADEMGLGKTAQTCVYLSCLRPLLDDPGPHLVVVPASLLENWQRELRLWAPNLKVVTYYGPTREQLRHRIKRQWGRICAGLDPGPDDEGEQQEVLEGGEEGGQVDDGADADDPYGDGGSAEEEEEVDEEEYGQLPPPQRQTGKGGGCGGLFDVLLTTYTVWEREGPAYGIDRAFLSKWPWSHVVMDEAHALKNSSSTRSKKLRKVAQLAATRIMLTGTPLQNDLLELHALLAFLLPTIFHAGEGADALAEQVAEVARPVPGAGSGAGAAAQAARAAAQGRLVERMKQLLQPFILRRLKSEVADQLVAKQQHIVLLDMVPEQRELYASTIASMRDEVSKEVSQAAAAGGPGRGRGRGRGRPRRGTALKATEEAAASSPGGPGAAPAGPLDMSRLSSSRVQHIFTQLRKVAQHPLLIRSRYTKEQVTELANLAATRGLFGGSPTVERCLQELSSYSDHQLHCFALGHPKLLESYILPEDSVLCSAKIRHLDGLLPKLKEKGSRVLLFSQWTTVLDLLEWYMHLRGYQYCRLDGGTQVEDRLALVDAFNAPDSPYFVFLLSTRAGGQGLNLTGADTVILHDVDFNPQIDKQAEDRAHRLGQTRTVAVYRFITRGTVDSNIQAIAERKLALDAAVLTDVTVGAGAEGGGRGRGRGRGRGAASAVETRHMAEILSSLLTPAEAEAADPASGGAGGGSGGGYGGAAAGGGWGSGGGAGPSMAGMPPLG